MVVTANDPMGCDLSNFLRDLAKNGNILGHDVSMGRDRVFAAAILIDTQAREVARLNAQVEKWQDAHLESQRAGALIAVEKARLRIALRNAKELLRHILIEGYNGVNSEEISRFLGAADNLVGAGEFDHE